VLIKLNSKTHKSSKNEYLILTVSLTSWLQLVMIVMAFAAGAN